MADRLQDTGRYVFCLAADAGSAYVRLCHVAVALLKDTDPTASTVVVTDRQTVTAHPRDFGRLQSLADEVHTCRTPDGTAYLRSRYLKSRLRQEVAGPFIYLDADAHVIRPIGDLFGVTAPFAAVLDRSPRRGFPEDARVYFDKLGWGGPTDVYVNSGVFYAEDSDVSHELFARWHRLWLEGSRATGRHVDQPALNKALQDLRVPLRILPDACNAMVEMSVLLARGARVFHYFMEHLETPRRRHLLLTHLLDHFERTGELDVGAVREARRRGDPWIHPTACWRRALVTGRYRQALGLLLTGALGSRTIRAREATH